MTFDRTVIYPHDSFQKHLKTGRLALTGQSLTRTYVAITRARYSIAIVVPNGFKSDLLPPFRLRAEPDLKAFERLGAPNCPLAGPTKRLLPKIALPKVVRHSGWQNICIKK